MNLTFLNGAFLFAALAALLPLIIHLISRRRVSTVDFSSLRFLRELERKRIRRVRLRQILLLVVRSLIILCVALALARPTLSGVLGRSSTSHARTSVAIVLDNSASMSRVGDDGELFEAAQGRVEELAGLLDEGDQAFLVTAGYPVRQILPDGTFSPQVLAGSAHDVPSGYGSTDYVSAIEAAIGQLDGSRNLTRELYVIGDMQRTGWKGESEGVEATAAPRTRVYFIPISGHVGNLGLSSVDVDRSYGGTPGLFAVSASVVAFGWRGGNVPVRLFVDGVQAGQAGVDLEDRGSASARFSVTVDENAWHVCRVELPPDAMSADNVWHFVIPPASRTDVLLVRNASDDARDDAYYIQRALDPTGDGRRFACSVTDARSLESQDQGRFPVVVLADVARLDRGGVSWLRRHVENGGGLLLVFGNRTDLRFWNEELLPDLVGAELIRPVERPEGVRLAPAGPGHPMLQGLVFGDRLIDDIYVRRALELDAVEAEEVLELPGIGPALFFVDRGTSGEVACLTTGVDPSWNDLPRSGFIVPLMDRVVGRLARASEQGGSEVVGDDITVGLPATSAGGVEVASPDGSVSMAEVVSAGRPAAIMRNVRTPGVYVFRPEVGGELMVAVNVDPRESDLTAYEGDELRESVAPLPSVIIAPGSDLANAVLTTRYGRELWRLFIYAAILLVALEMILARVRYV